MILSEAIRLRIIELLKQNNLIAYKLAYRAGISSSNISDCMRDKVKEPTISTILHICEGFSISLSEFFNSPIFDDTEAIDRFDKKRA